MSDNERPLMEAVDNQENVYSTENDNEQPSFSHVGNESSPSINTPMPQNHQGQFSNVFQQTVSPSPPKHISMDELAEAANNFYKMTLAHEISLDSNFKVTKNEAEKEPLHSAVKETMHRAFWDIQRAKLEADPPDYRPALNMLKEIVESLCNLTMPHQKHLQEFIPVKIGLEAAEAELAETGRLNLEDYANSVIELLGQMCAPVRDKELEKLKHVTDSIEFFRRVFEFLELMHMDLANFAIRKMRPFIRHQAGDYEREQFEKFLQVQAKVGIDGLAHTRQWIKDAYEKLLAEANRQAPCSTVDASSSCPSSPSTSSNPTPLTPNNILREAYLALLTWDKEDLPETIVVDGRRIEALSHCLARTVTLATLILTVCNTVASNYILFVPPGETTLPQGAMVRLKERISKDAKGIIDGTPARRIASLKDLLAMRVLLVVAQWGASLRAVDTSDEALTIDPVNTGLPESLCDQLVGQVTSVLSGQHAVYILIFNRALEFLRKCLSASPPDPLVLPSGYGALSESSSLQPGSSVQERLVAGRTVDDCACCPSPSPKLEAKRREEEMRDSIDLNRVYDLAVIASRIMPLVAHNRHVFGPNYAEIIHSLLFPTSSSTAS